MRSCTAPDLCKEFGSSHSQEKEEEDLDFICVQISILSFRRLLKDQENYMELCTKAVIIELQARWDNLQPAHTH
jgi:hypothetical protein